jgi:GxxExxY protein
MTESDLKHHRLTRTILGAFFRTHTDLGYGFLEKVYVNGLCVLLRQFGLTVEREVPYEMFYLGERIGLFRADCLVEGRVLVEGKTGPKLDAVYLARTRNYLRVSKLEVGLLLNWAPTAQFKRLISSPDGRLVISAGATIPAISGTTA